MGKRKTQIAEVLHDQKVKEGLSSEEWEMAYLALAKKNRELERIGKEILRLAAKMF